MATGFRDWPWPLQALFFLGLAVVLIAAGMYLPFLPNASIRTQLEAAQATEPAEATARRRAIMTGCGLYLAMFALFYLADAFSETPPTGRVVLALLFAFYCAQLSFVPLVLWPMVGRGTGLDDAGVRRKTEVVVRALELHRGALGSGESMLAALGGFEIAAMAGVCLAGAALNVPIVVDGFIATAAAAIAEKIRPGLFEHLFFSHRSAEGGHALALEHLKVRPIFDLDMRLGEGTGAALAMNVIESALDLFHNMATCASAGVSGKVPGKSQ